jgi:hypothetical protein
MSSSTDSGGDRPTAAGRGGLRTVGLVALGCVVGVSLSTFVLPRLVRSGRAEREHVFQPVITSAAPALGGDSAKVRELERRLASLEHAAKDEPNAASSAEPKADAPEPNPGDDQPSSVTRNLEAAKANHANEARDPEWADATTRSLSQDFAVLQREAGGFDTISVDCRTTLCRADIAWKSRMEANDNWEQVLHHRYQANCRRIVLLRSEPDGSGAQHADLTFDCAGWRADAM